MPRRNTQKTYDDMAIISTNHEEVGFGLERFDEAKNPFLEYRWLFDNQPRVNFDYYEDNVDDDWYKKALGELAVKPYLVECLCRLSEHLSTNIELVDGTFLWGGHWTFDLSVDEAGIRDAAEDMDLCFEGSLTTVFKDLLGELLIDFDEQRWFDHYMDVFEKQHDPEESCDMDEYNDFITTITKSLPDTVEEMDDYFSTGGWNWHERAVKENYRTNKELTDKLHDLYQQYVQEDAYTDLIAYVYPSGLWHEEQAYFLREIIADYFTALDNQPAQLKLQLCD
jgi:hypothetical protein